MRWRKKLDQIVVRESRDALNSALRGRKNEQTTSRLRQLAAIHFGFRV